MVMMSGGVDSSVAAALLVEQGYAVTGVTLKLWGGESDSGCCSVSDVEDARRVAAQLGIDHYVFNFSEEFEARVVDPYVDAYANGRTPNPCVECNRTVKFGRVLRRADQLGFELVATGHHARVVRDASGRHHLHRGADPAKDQSYVLAMLGPAELARTLLPVGELTKAEVRRHAARLGLRTAEKPESMDVCFITKGGRGAFLDARTPARPGNVIDAAGEVVGSHAGVAGFTVGQRRGVGVAVGERRYVVDVDANTATVTLGRRADLLRREVELEQLTFTELAVADGSEVVVQVRAHGSGTPAALRGRALHWIEPQPRVAPGQLVAMYDPVDGRVLGSAVVAA